MTLASPGLVSDITSRLLERTAQAPEPDGSLSITGFLGNRLTMYRTSAVDSLHDSRDCKSPPTRPSAVYVDITVINTGRLCTICHGSGYIARIIENWSDGTLLCGPEVGLDDQVVLATAVLAKSDLDYPAAYIGACDTWKKLASASAPGDREGELQVVMVVPAAVRDWLSRTFVFGFTDLGPLLPDDTESTFDIFVHLWRNNVKYDWKDENSLENAHAALRIARTMN